MAGYAAFGTVERGRVSALPTVRWWSGSPVEDTRVDDATAMIEDAADEAVAAPGATPGTGRTAREQWSIDVTVRPEQLR
jgi:hypothetical protein